MSIMSRCAMDVKRKILSLCIYTYRVSQKKLGLAETGHGYILYGINERKTLLLHSKFIVLNANTWFDSKDIKF